MNLQGIRRLNEIGEVSQYTMKTFYREADDYDIEIECPICDGHGSVTYYDMNDNETESDCPHCQGRGVCFTSIFVDDIEDEIDTEDYFIPTLYTEGGIRDTGHNIEQTMHKVNPLKLAGIAGRMMEQLDEEHKAKALRRQELEEELRALAMEREQLGERMRRLSSQLDRT